MASPGCKKNAGVPVLARVDAIFPAICPDFPMPVSITLPFIFKISSATFLKCLSKLFSVKRIDSASIRIASLAVFKTSIHPPI